MSLGLAINANGAIPDRAELATLGIGSGGWLRTAIQGPLSLLDNLMTQVPDGVNVMATVNNECREVGSDWSGWENALRTIAARNYAGRLKVLGAGNELDIFYANGDRSVSPAFAADLVKRAAPILRPAGIKVAIGSVASGDWVNYLKATAALCRGSADYADLHLYVKRLNGIPNDPNWQTAADALAEARSVSGLPVISSEAGIKVDDAGGLQAQANWAGGLATLPGDLICYWCWHDKMASPGETGGQAFGARGLDNKPKPVWFELQRMFGGPLVAPAPVAPPVPTPTFVLGFADVAARHPDIVGLPLRNERGPWANCSTQPTDRGILLWGDFVGTGSQMGFIGNDAALWVWTGDHLEQQ